MSSVFTPEKIHKASELIHSAGEIVITTHRSPDGDAIGSSLALCHFLTALGKSSRVIVPDDYPEFLHWLPGHRDVLVFEKNKEEAAEVLKAADLLFSLDYNDLSRTGPLEEALTAIQKPFILIDHHQQPGVYPVVCFSDTASCSTAEMIFDFISAMGKEDLIDSATGSCIYTGIMTDSGSFRFPAVTGHTHRIAARLIEKGVDHAQIHREVYDNNLINRLQLVGYALTQKLKQVEGCAAAYLVLERGELDRFGYQPGDTEGLVNYALSIRGVKLAVFVREGSNTVKLSFRSAGQFDVNQFARKYFKGGGHRNAAGGAMDAPVAEVEALLLDAIKKHCHELDAS